MRTAPPDLGLRRVFQNNIGGGQTFNNSAGPQWSQLGTHHLPITLLCRGGWVRALFNGQVGTGGTTGGGKIGLRFAVDGVGTLTGAWFTRAANEAVTAHLETCLRVAPGPHVFWLETYNYEGGNGGFVLTTASNIVVEEL